MVDSVASSGGGFSGGFSGGGDIGGIGSSGLSSFDLGGIADNGGGPAPTGTGALGDAGLSPIGSSGLTAFGPPGGQSEAAKLDHYDDLVQQNWDQLDANRQSNEALSRSISEMGQQTTPPLSTMEPIAPPRFEPPPPFPTFTLPPPPDPGPLPIPPAFTSQPLDPASVAPPAPATPTFALPETVGGPLPAASGIADLPAPLPAAPADAAAPFTPFAMTPDALASPVTRPDIAAPAVDLDPFAPVGQGGLGLTPVGAPALTTFGPGGPVPVAGAEAGILPAADGAAGFAAWPAAAGWEAGSAPDGSPFSPLPMANQAGFFGPAPEPTANLALDPTPLAQWGLDGTPPVPAQPAAPPPIGYGDRPLGVPVSQVSGLTAADAQGYVGSRMDAWRDAATPADQDGALQDALNAAYAYRVQGGDAAAFDRIAERAAGDPRAEIETKVARDRAEAIVAAGVSGNIRALNDNGVNFGAQLYALQRNLANDPDYAFGTISRTLDGLRYGEGAGSAVNNLQAGATRQALTALGFGREIQDAAAFDAARSEGERVAQAQALAGMTPSERFSYGVGQAMDAGALGVGGIALGMAIVGGRTGPYANLADSPSVGPGKSFTGAQKAKIYQQNMKTNDGVLRSDLDGTQLVMPSRSRTGVKPPTNEAQVDHILPRKPSDPSAPAGANSFSNAQVLSREQNRTKSNK